MTSTHWSVWFFAAIIRTSEDKASGSLNLPRSTALNALSTRQKRSYMSSLRPVLNQIAHSTNRVQQLRIERVINFGSQSSNCHFNNIRIAIEVHIPYMLCQHQTRYDLTLTAHKNCQQAELFSSQIDACVATHHTAS